MSSTPSLFPEQASSIAVEVDMLYGFMIAVSGFFAVLIAVLVVYFAIQYRRRSPDEVGADIHGSLVLELAWTIIPLGLAMVMFGWGAKVFLTIARPPDNAMEMFVVGKQWMWKVQHMEGKREINRIHVPVGQPVKLTITSEDVLHSFYIPAFRVKMDAVPGRYTNMWFEATKPGEYHLFCAEYCGTEHSGMIGKVIALPQDEYQAWLAEPAPVIDTAAHRAPFVPTSVGEDESAGGGSAGGGGMAKAGEALFAAKGCIACHMQQDGGLGPSLVGVLGKERKFADGSSTVADEAYLRESILNPLGKIVDGYQPVMPTFQGQLSEEELMQLIQYIKSLGAAQADAEPETGSSAEGEES